MPFFIVRSLRDAVDFYVQRLGFQSVLEVPEDDPFFALVSRDGVSFCLKQIGTDTLPVPNHTRHEWARWDAYVDTRNPDALFAEYVAAGVTIHAPLEHNDDGLRAFEIRDGDGYVICFGCDSAEVSRSTETLTDIDVREVSILSHDAQSLIALLDAELSAEYAPEDRHTVDFEPFHRDGGVFFVAHADGIPVGCGALRPLSETDVELKRMFVVASYRRRGVSRCILTRLEERARALGYQRLVLETGDEQAAAIAFYASAGFHRVEPFGEYIGGARSVCFAKLLN